jgi:adenylate kinase family enzyme
MKRIMVIGISAGVGKSTFARELGKRLDLPVYHMDSLYWKAGWIESEPEEFAARQREIVKKDKWIIEGNYNNTFSIRAEQADTIIYLELPLYVCLYRVIKRWLTNLGKTRPDMPQGCTEKMEWSFIKFILTTYYPRKRKMVERLQAHSQNRTIITLRNKRDISSYLKSLKQ